MQPQVKTGKIIGIFTAVFAVLTAGVAALINIVYPVGSTMEVAVISAASASIVAILLVTLIMAAIKKAAAGMMGGMPPM